MLDDVRIHFLSKFVLKLTMKDAVGQELEEVLSREYQVEKEKERV